MRRRRSSSQIPELPGAARRCDQAASAERGQSPTYRTAPARVTSRACTDREPSQSGAASPRTTAAVAAMFAARHDDAATLTVRHGVSAGRPVLGSIRWCASPVLVGQRRTEVPDVARPPVCSDTSGPPTSCECSMVVRDADAPAARRPSAGDGDVPSQGDEHTCPKDGSELVSSVVCLLRFRGRAEVELDAVRYLQCLQLVVDDHVEPSLPRSSRADRPAAAAADERERAVVARVAERAADRRVDEPVGLVRRGKCDLDRGTKFRRRLVRAAGVRVRTSRAPNPRGSGCTGGRAGRAAPRAAHAPAADARFAPPQPWPSCRGPRSCPHRGATDRSRAPGDGHGRGGGRCGGRRGRGRLRWRDRGLRHRDERRRGRRHRRSSAVARTGRDAAPPSGAGASRPTRARQRRAPSATQPAATTAVAVRTRFTAASRAAIAPRS